MSQTSDEFLEPKSSTEYLVLIMRLSSSDCDLREKCLVLIMRLPSSDCEIAIYYE